MRDQRLNMAPLVHQFLENILSATDGVNFHLKREKS